MREPRLIWFTGLSGSGKTTLANVLAVTLKKYQTNSIILDGDLVRCVSNFHESLFIVCYLFLGIKKPVSQKAKTGQTSL